METSTARPRPGANEGPWRERAARLVVDPEAAARNWRYFAGLGAREAGAVVKADAYGLGAPAMARALAKAGCRTFFTATLGEALAVRAALGAGPVIYALNGAGARAEQAGFAAGAVRPVLNSMAAIAAWGEASPAGLHLDTGMNRLGVPAAEAGAARDALGAPPTLVMSHLACASDPAHPFNARQRQRFLDAAALFPGAPRSLAASAGALLGPDYAFDLIRPGIGLYGGWPLDTPADAPLAVCAAVYAPILQVRTIAAGESVGYGASFVATAAMRVATVGIGYADGLLRSLSGKGYGFVAGTACAILGRVSMDLVALDVTSVAAGQGVEEGDEVEMLGLNMALNAVAAQAGTLAYEILTSFGAALARAPARGGA